MSFITNTQRTDNLNLANNEFMPLVVASGTDSANLLSYSTDGGVTWAKTGSKSSGGVLDGMTNIQGITTNGTIWVAVGNKGTGASSQAYSYDGKNWISNNTIPSNPAELSGIAWNGNLFVSGSSSMYYSYDGIKWYISGTTPFSTKVQVFVWISINTNDYMDNGFWLCGGIGSQSLSFSNCGLLWRGLGTNSPFGINGYCYGICTDGSGLVVVGGNGNSQTMAYATFTPINDYFDPSLIGTSGTYSGISYNYTWTTLGSDSPFGTSTGFVNSIAYNGKIWLAVGKNSGVNIAYSYDGKSWISLGSKSPFGTNINSECRSVCWTGKYWVIVGSNNTSATTISLAYCVNPLGTWTTDSGSVLFSSIGNGCCAASNIVPMRNDGIYGTGGRVGIQFQKGARNTMNLISGGNQVATIGEKGFKNLQLDDEYGVFIKSPISIVAGPNTGAVNTYYSFNGMSFTSIASSPYSVKVNKIAWNGKVWVSVGNGTNTIAYSYDGILWTGLGTTIFSTSGLGVIWIGTMFIAGGEKGSGTNTLAYSYDGINWIGLGSNIFTTGCNAFEWNGNMILGLGYGTNTMAYSYDGLTWTGVTNNTSIFSTQGRCAVWNGTIFVAVGEGTNSLAWSRDGLTWNGLGNTRFSTRGNYVCWSGTYFVACGAGTNALAWSKDGINWTGLGTFFLFTNMIGVAWTGTRFICTGVGSFGKRVYYTSGNNPASGNWINSTNTFFGGDGEFVYGGYWKWSGNIINPTIDFRTSGKNTAGIISINNGLAITGYEQSTGVQRTLMNINTNGNVFSNPTFLTNGVGIGSGTFIKAIQVGRIVPGSSTGTVSFSPAFPAGSNVRVIGTIESNLTTQVYSFHTHTILNSGFSWVKTFYNFSTNAGGGATAEPVSWVAFCV